MVALRTRVIYQVNISVGKKDKDFFSRLDGLGDHSACADDSSFELLKYCTFPVAL